MSRNFNLLRDKMSQESRDNAKAKTVQMLQDACLCDEYGSDLCPVHKTHCIDCGQRILNTKDKSTTIKISTLSGFIMSSLSVTIIGFTWIFSAIMLGLADKNMVTNTDVACWITSIFFSAVGAGWLCYRADCKEKGKA